MIKAKLIEQAYEKFGGTNPTAKTNSKIHKLNIEQYCVMAYEQLLQTVSRFNDYQKPYKDIAVLHDHDVDTWYSIVPAKIAQLPNNLFAVKIDYMQTNNVSSFVPMDRDSWDMWETLRAGKISKEIGFAVMGTRIEYQSKPIHDKVKMRLVVAFDEWNDDEDVPMPNGDDFKFWQLLEQQINGQQPTDKYNNGVAK